MAPEVREKHQQNPKKSSSNITVDLALIHQDAHVLNNVSTPLFYI